MWVQSLGWEDPLEKKMATHTNIFAWEIPWTEEPSGLRFMGSKNNQTYVHILGSNGTKETMERSGNVYSGQEKALRDSMAISSYWKSSLNVRVLRGSILCFSFLRLCFLYLNDPTYS